MAGEIEELPQWFHYVGSKPNLVVSKGTVIFKSLPVYRDSKEESFPDFLTYGFDIDDSDGKGGCVLCDIVYSSATRHWGFKSHCFTHHPWLCKYKDICQHKKGLCEILEKAYKEAVQDKSDGKASKRKIESFFSKTSTAVTKVDLTFRQLITKCICLDFLPLTFASSPGFQSVLKFINKSAIGLSARSIVREMELMHDKMKDEKCQQFFKDFDIKKRDDGSPIFELKHYKIASLTHDLWSSNSGNMPMMGLHMHWIAIAEDGCWELRCLLLGCVFMPVPHSAANVLIKIKDLLATWGLIVEVFICATQDTTGASINVFDAVASIEQLLCMGHTNQLVMKHSITDVPAIKNVFQSMSAGNAKLKGKPKRLEALTVAGQSLNIVPKPPMLNAETRWDTYEKVAENFFHNLEIYKLIDPTAIFDKAEARDAWNECLLSVSDAKPVIVLIQPFLRLCAQWTQVLSSRHEVTISLVRVAIRSLRGWESSARESNTAMIRNGNIDERNNAYKFVEYLDALKERLDEYYGDQFYNYGLFTVAEFLDPRTFFAIEDQAAQILVVRHLRDLADAGSTAVPPAARLAGGGRGRGPTTTHLLYDRFAPAQNLPQLSPFDLEVNSFIQYMVTEVTEATALRMNPLDFWSRHDKRFPILASIARRVLAIPPTEAECERTFSVSGRVHTKARNKLSPDHVNHIVSLHGWLLMDQQNRSRASVKRAKTTAERVSRFAQFMVIEETLQILPGAGEDEEDDYEE